MFSQTAEYILRVVVYLAGQRQAVTTHQIAGATRVPEGYLAKVLQSLGRAALVESQRGLHGGFVLAGDPAQLTVYDALHGVEPFQRIEACPLGLEAHKGRLCPLHRSMDQALETMEKALRAITIKDLLANPDDSPMLCACTAAAAARSPRRRSRKAE